VLLPRQTTFLCAASKKNLQKLFYKVNKKTESDKGRNRIFMPTPPPRHYFSTNGFEADIFRAVSPKQNATGSRLSD
jgi:hypothetical protein